MYKLNRYSIALICVYLAAVFSMEYGFSYANWAEGIINSLPVIVFVVIWSEKLTFQLNYQKTVSTKESFHRDFFMINYATLFSFVASLLFEHNNSDATGWWPLLIVAAVLYGVVFGAVFAAFSLLLNKQHFGYTLIFALILLLNFSTFKFMQPYINTIMSRNIPIFPVCVILLLSVHALVCLAYRVRK